MHTEREAAEAETPEEAEQGLSMARSKGYASVDAAGRGALRVGRPVLCRLSEAGAGHCSIGAVGFSITCRCLEAMLPERQEGSAQRAGGDNAK